MAAFFDTFGMLGPRTSPDPHSMKDWLRNLLSIRQKRQSHSSKGAPKVGGAIICEGVTMRVTTPMPQELWEWMVLSGWRHIPVANDRRATIELPEDALAQLVRAAPTERNSVHARLLLAAKQQAS